MECPNCKKRITAARLNKAISRRANDGLNRDSHKVYCNKVCFRTHKNNTATERRTCPECGIVRPSRVTYRCAVCRSMAVSEHRLDSEVKSLIMLNPGTGFDYFIDMVFGKDGTAPSRAFTRSRLTQFLMDLQECEEGVDYIGWLQNPDAMLTMSQDKVPANMEKYIRGQRRSTVSSHVQNSRIKSGVISAEDARVNSKVKIPPKFRWGDYKPR